MSLLYAVCAVLSVHLPVHETTGKFQHYGRDRTLCNFHVIILMIRFYWVLLDFIIWMVRKKSTFFGIVQFTISFNQSHTQSVTHSVVARPVKENFFVWLNFWNTHLEIHDPVVTLLCRVVVLVHKSCWLYKLSNSQSPSLTPSPFMDTRVAWCRLFSLSLKRELQQVGEFF